jgi:hypothetical protein
LGIVAAYDFQGDPNNSYAKGDGVAHIGTNNYTKSHAPTLLAVTEHISGRDVSQGRTIAGTYRGTNIGALGFGSADGKGGFTIHRRFRTPSSASGQSGARAITEYRDAGAAKITLIMHEVAGYCHFRWEFWWYALPSAALSDSTVANRVSYNSIVDLHVTRSGDTLKIFVNGVLLFTGSSPGLTTLNTNWGGTAPFNGLTTGNPADLVWIDETYWNRALSDSEVAAHQADPYYGYVNVIPAPTGTITDQPAPDGQSQRFAGTTTNATIGTYTLTGSNGGTTVGPLPFGVADNAFDFSATGLPPGTYSPTLTVTGPGGTAGVTGISTFSIAGVGGGGEVYPPAPVSIVASVVVSPSTATGSGTFTAVVNGTNSPSQAVTWAASAGSINSAGVFTAPAATGSAQTITITATSVQDPSVSGTATVTIAAEIPTVVAVSVSPSLIASLTAATAQFSATVSGTNSPPQTVTWSASSGGISSSGLFTAPARTDTTQTITITATSVFDPSKSGTATAIIPAQEVITYELEALSPSVLQRYTTTGSLRLVLNFIDTPAPAERTIVLGARSRTITAG